MNGAYRYRYAPFLVLILCLSPLGELSLQVTERALHPYLSVTPLPLPLGEVAERSEDGEGKPDCNTLSVT